MKLKARMNLPCLWRSEDLRNHLDRFFAFAWCALCRLRSISASSSSSSNRYPPLLKCFLWFRNSKSEEMMSILQNAISTWREGKIIKPVRRYVLFPFWKVGMNQNDVHETVLFRTAICFTFAYSSVSQERNLLNFHLSLRLLSKDCSNHSFEIWPGGSTEDPADSKLEPDRIEDKIWKGKT